MKIEYDRERDDRAADRDRRRKQVESQTLMLSSIIIILVFILDVDCENMAKYQLYVVSKLETKILIKCQNAKIQTMESRMT